jgi:hypothetical protein
MATANTADAWRQGGEYPDRSSSAARAPWPDRGAGAARPSRPLRTGPARPVRPADRLRAAEGRDRDMADFARSSPPRRGADAARSVGRPERGRFEGRRPDARRPVERPSVERPRADERRPSARPAEPRQAPVTARPRPAKPTAESGRLRGIVAVLAMFLVTLAGAGVDSFVGIGLGLVTLVSMVGVTVLAALMVRRRDLLSVIAAPPLVFVAVAAINVALAPSASFNIPTMATLLVRGFPTMAIATGVALVLGLIRLAARR